MTHVVWAGDSKTGIRIEIGPRQQKLWHGSHYTTDEQSSCTTYVDLFHHFDRYDFNTEHLNLNNLIYLTTQGTVFAALVSSIANRYSFLTIKSETLSS